MHINRGDWGTVDQDPLFQYITDPLRALVYFKVQMITY